tara:strand:- start:567 stop:1082 length:516 start_codon:yes stop_codon:yes gene_type:complete
MENPMNIFYLHRDPVAAAQMQCDKHVVKMILESAQMLSTAHRVLDGDIYADLRGMYKLAHKNHPSTRWVRSNYRHYNWLWKHMKALMKEYTIRYGKTHATERLNRGLSIEPANIDFNDNFIDPPQCMPDQYKNSDTVQAYRDYYIGEKSSFAKWDKCGKIPKWYRKGKDHE